MKVLRIFIFDIVAPAVIIGWLLWKYPEQVSALIPWLAEGVLCHLTIEVFETSFLKTRLNAVFERGGTRFMIWILVFCLGGIVSTAYWFSIQKGLAKLASLNKVHEPTTEKQPGKPLPPNAPRSFVELEEAKRRLEFDPDKVTLHDLFATDFSSSETVYPQTWHLEALSKPKIDIESIVAWRLSEGTELIAFYIPYTKETHDICVSWVAHHFKEIMQDKHKFGVEQKIPGQSPQLSASNLMFPNRIYVYHEAYIAPEEEVDLKNVFKNLGIQVILRSSDFLANRSLEAKVKLLEKKN